MALASRLVTTWPTRVGSPASGTGRRSVSTRTPVSSRQRGEQRDRVLGHVAQVERPDVQLQPAGVGAGQQQQGLDQALHPARRLEAGGEGLAVLAGRAVARQGQLGVRVDHRQRRAQLVRGVGGEPRLLEEGRLQPGEGGVEHAGQGGQFAGDAAGVDPARQVGGGEGLGGRGHRADGADGPPGEEPAADQADDEDGRPRCRPAATTRRCNCSCSRRTDRPTSTRVPSGPVEDDFADAAGLAPTAAEHGEQPGRAGSDGGSRLAGGARGRRAWSSDALRTVPSAR